MATEIAIFPLKDGKIPDDANSEAGQVLKDTFDVLTQQEGFQRLYWGREVENGTNFRLFVDWDSVDSHIKFTKADHYKPFLEHFGLIADVAKGQMCHVNLRPHPADEVLSDTRTPATEILVAYFPADYSQADQDKFEENIKNLVACVEKSADTHTASAGGWIIEEQTVPGTSDKSKAYQAFLGWTSVEAHLSFRETQAFKDNIHYLRGAKDLKHVHVVHYSGTLVTKEGGVGDMSGGALPSAQGEVLNPQAGTKDSVKTRSDGTTTKNNDDLKGAANSLKKERAGR